MTIKDLRRWDQGEVTKAEETREGFLDVRANVTRTGVFAYSNLDGSVRFELRHPEDVFNGDSLGSLKMIPMTLQHPVDLVVTKDNSEQLMEGFTGESVEPNGKFVTVNFRVTNKKAIDAINSGIVQLSLGYTLDVEEIPGVFEGERFDARQRNIRYNHLAIVDAARAGPEARILLDSMTRTDSIQDKSNKPPKERPMAKITIKNIDYEVPAEAANAFAEAVQKGDSLQKDLSTSKSELETTMGKLDGVTLENKTLKESNNDEAINKAVDAKMVLLAEASNHVDTKDLVDLSPVDIKKKVIMSKFPESKLDGKSEEYIDGQYEIAVKSQASNIKADDKVRKSGVYQDPKLNVDKKTHIDYQTRTGDAKAAHTASVDRLLKMWQKEPANA